MRWQGSRLVRAASASSAVRTFTPWVAITRSMAVPPAGLRIAANVSRSVVAKIVREMLRPGPGLTTLVVPAGTRSGVKHDGPTDLERCTAAGAIRALATTHPEVAAGGALQSLQRRP